MGNMKKPSAELTNWASRGARTERDVNTQAVPRQRKERKKSNKTRRLFDDHAAMMADQAHKQSVEKGVKISESDIIAEALDMWCKARGVDLDDYRD